MSKPYCGTGDPPKGYRRGTVEECIKMKQVRYYGLEKISAKELENKKKKKGVSRSELMKKHVKLAAQVKKFIEKIKKETDKDKKDKMKTKAKEAHTELLEIDGILKQMEKDKKKKEKKNKKK